MFSIMAQLLAQPGRQLHESCLLGHRLRPSSIPALPHALWRLCQVGDDEDLPWCSSCCSPWWFSLPSLWTPCCLTRTWTSFPRHSSKWDQIFWDLKKDDTEIVVFVIWYFMDFENQSLIKKPKSSACNACPSHHQLLFNIPEKRCKSNKNWNECVKRGHAFVWLFLHGQLLQTNCCGGETMLEHRPTEGRSGEGVISDHALVKSRLVWRLPGWLTCLSLRVPCLKC